jgi:hypothetical protein
MHLARGFQRVESSSVLPELILQDRQIPIGIGDGLLSTVTRMALPDLQG